MNRRARNPFGLLLVVLMVAAAVLQSPVLRFLPARATAFGSEATLGLGCSDHHAVLQNKQGQTSEFRGRWDPPSGAAWVHESVYVVPVGAAVARLGVGRSGPHRVSHRSRVGCWLL